MCDEWKPINTAPMEERWKIIPQHPVYEISNLGRVRNYATSRVLKPFQDNHGYARITLPGNKKYKLHRLVAIQWVPNPDDKPQVAHLDADRTNARVDNLMWVTQSENEYHKTIDFKSTRECW